MYMFQWMSKRKCWCVQMAQSQCSSKIAVHSIASTYAGTSPFVGLPTVLSLIAFRVRKNGEKVQFITWMGSTEGGRGRSDFARTRSSFWSRCGTFFASRALETPALGQETTRPEARFFDQGPLPPRKTKRYSRDTNIGLSRFGTSGPEVIWTLSKIWTPKGSKYLDSRSE